VSATSETWEIAGRAISMSNLDKLLWPDEGFTKRDMLNYYRAVASTMLPYLKDRPVTLRVYHNGIQGAAYYRRELPKGGGKWLGSAEYRPETTQTPIQVPIIDDAAGLLWLANQGGIEFHVWAVRLPHLAEPDLVIFDLDPGEKASFADVRQAALLLREELSKLKLKSFAKTSGGRGLHLFIPLAPEYTFDAIHAWSKALSEQLAQAHPKLMALPEGGTHRGNRVTIDYVQNSVARNTAAPYTLRARPGASVSAPLTWEEIALGKLDPSDLTLQTVPDRIQQIGDPFQDVLEPGQRLPSLPGPEAVRKGTVKSPRAAKRKR
jgi:bifunctional non-homologous end joining protein LigD